MISLIAAGINHCREANSKQVTEKGSTLQKYALYTDVALGIIVILGGCILASQNIIPRIRDFNCMSAGGFAYLLLTGAVAAFPLCKEYHETGTVECIDEWLNKM